jgi:hypothetical protein
VLGNLHLRFLEDFLEVTNAERTLRQDMQDAQPRAVAKTLIDFDQIHGQTSGAHGLLVPAAGAETGFADRQHDRHLNEHADHGSERRRTGWTEKCDRHRDRQLEEVARANERAGEAMLCGTFRRRIRP